MRTYVAAPGVGCHRDVSGGDLGMCHPCPGPRCHRGDPAKEPRVGPGTTCKSSGNFSPSFRSGRRHHSQG